MQSCIKTGIKLYEELYCNNGAEIVKKKWISTSTCSRCALINTPKTVRVVRQDCVCV